MTQDPLIVSPTAPPQARTTRFGRVRRWLTGRRGGSVLILVVALLVLLALIGTAFITTAGADRDSSTQHVYNTEIDLLVAGTKNLAVRQLTTSVLTPQPPYDYRTPAFPPGTPSFHSAIPKSRMTVLESTAPNYGKPWLEYSNVDYAPWNPALADRYPARPPGAPGSPPEWRYISANPLALTQNLTTPTLLYTDPPPQWVYGSPPTPATFTLPQFSSPFVGTDVNGQVIVSNYSSRARMQPWYATVKVNNVTRIYPAFKINDPNDPNFGKIVLAADADGDGIPDAGYFELPVGQINGLRYFAGFRVIDNNSALNVSVAWENFRNAEPNDALLPTDVFPTNVDLRRMVEGLYTAKGDSVNDVGPDPDPNPSVVNDSPFDKLNFRRFGATSVGLGSDGAFTYATRFDALWGQLGARLDNPSFNSSAGTKFAPLGVSESVALARRFCLSDPTGSAGGVVENLLPGSFRMTSVVRQPFQADQAFGSASSWFESIFDYDNPAFSRARTPLRPMVTAYNPVTNYTPGFIGDPRVPLAETEREGKYQFRGDWPDSIDTFGAKKFAPPTYHVGDWVTYKGKGYVCIRVHNWASLATDGQPITSGQTYNAVSHPPAFVYSSSNDRPPPGNPQLKNAPPQGTPDFAYWAEAPWISQTVKTNINTASFGQLFAAYMNIMGDAPMTYPGGTPMTAPEVTGGYPGNQYWSFGNVRRPTLTVPVVPPMNSKQSEAIRQLRAAIAAVNTIDLRDQDEDVTSRSIVLTDVDGNEIYRTSVYGSERQPYLTESIVHIPEDESKHYVAIELFNPSPLPLKLDAFRLYYRGRDPTTDGTLTLIRDLRTDDKEIPPFGYLYIENSKANRPDDMTTVKGTDVYAGKTVIEVPLLEEVLKHGGTRELYLLRTRRFDGTVTSNDVGVADSPNQFNEANPLDLIPVDQLEFVGMLPEMKPSPADPTLGVPVPVRYHYRRATTFKGDSYVNRWHCVYSGPYDPSAQAAAKQRRQRGWIRDPLPELPLDPDITKQKFSLPGWGDKKEANTAEVWVHNLDNKLSEANRATFRTRTLQIANFGMGGPWKPRMPDPSGKHDGDAAYFGGTTTSMFPLGGFLRAGDVMQVPFCGGYKLTGSGIAETFPELNSISLDAAFADDGDKVDDDENGGVGGHPVEQLGRFCPIYNPAKGIDDISIPAAGNRRVAWARDLFDYFTVISPQDDYSPNVDPDQYMYLDPASNQYLKRSGDPTLPGSAPKWGVQPAPTYGPPFGKLWTDNGVQVNSVIPPGIANGLSKVAGRGLEDNVGIQGMININTANWKVIACLPFTRDRITNENIAKAIVAYRDHPTNGRPFRSLFELMLIPTVLNAMGNPATLNPQFIDGDITPLPAEIATVNPSATDDGVIGDFEARYLVINRISNMVSFRSDSFTVYVVVQGWRNAGTSSPELVVQRRTAMIVDRSRVRAVLPNPGWVTPPADPHNPSDPEVKWTGVTVSNPITTNVPQN